MSGKGTNFGLDIIRGWGIFQCLSLWNACSFSLMNAPCSAAIWTDASGDMAQAGRPYLRSRAMILPHFPLDDAARHAVLQLGSYLQPGRPYRLKVQAVVTVFLYRIVIQGLHLLPCSPVLVV